MSQRNFVEVERVRLILEDARAIVSNPGTWVTSATAVDGKGRRVQSSSRKAVAWSLSGAIVRAGLLRSRPFSEIRDVLMLTDRLAISQGFPDADEMNRRLSYHKLLGFLDDAIAHIRRLIFGGTKTCTLDQLLDWIVKPPAPGPRFTNLIRIKRHGPSVR